MTSVPLFWPTQPCNGNAPPHGVTQVWVFGLHAWPPPHVPHTPPQPSGPQVLPVQLGTQTGAFGQENGCTPPGSGAPSAVQP